MSIKNESNSEKITNTSQLYEQQESESHVTVLSAFKSIFKCGCNEASQKQPISTPLDQGLPCQMLNEPTSWENEKQIGPIQLKEISCRPCSRRKNKSRYSRMESTAPPVPSKVIFTHIPPIRDSIVAAESVTAATVHGTKNISSTDDERIRELQMGEDPNDPCANEISRVLQCVAACDNLDDCDINFQELRECKIRNNVQ